MNKSLYIMKTKNGNKNNQNYYVFVATSAGYGKGYKKILSLGNLKSLEEKNSQCMDIMKGVIKTLSIDDDPEKIKEKLLNAIEPHSITNIMKNYGIDLIYEVIEKLEIFNSLEKTKHKNLKEILNYQIASRIINPNSIISSFNEKWKYNNDIETKKNTFYSLLDVLNDNKESILKNINQKMIEYGKREVQLIFYDSSTFYFETFVRNGLRYPGYSKDGKFKEDQIVIGMATDKDGVPIHFELFKGNTADVNTFIPFILSMKKTYDLKRITIIADRGMSSNRNLRFLEDLGIDFIISYRAKAGSKEFKKDLLNQDDYIGDENFKYKERHFLSEWKKGRLNGKSRRRIFTYSLSRAKKDAADRNIIINNFKKRQNKDGIVKADQMLGSKKYKYFNSLGNLEFTLNNEKIEEDSKYDGYYVYETSRIDLKASEIVDIYKKQWQIEENFRTLKGCLELRPVFVYTDNHIKGHFILCFLALVVIKFILNVINKNLKENGVIDENITNTKFIKAIESAIYIEKYSNNTLIEKIYINNDENKLNLENYEIYKKILKMVCNKK